MNDDDLVSITRADLRMLVDRASDDCGWPGREWQSDHQAVRIFAALNGPVRSCSDSELVIAETLPPDAQIVNADPLELAPGVPIAGNAWTFDAFWDVYPRREGKKAARKAWDRALKDGATPLQIITGAIAYRDLPGREPRYTAHPTTWLNQGRWEDELVDRTETTKTDRNRAAITKGVNELDRRTPLERMAELAGQQPKELGQ